MNGLGVLDESQRLDIPSMNQTCCLVDGGMRCKRLAGNASYSKRVQRTVQQKHLKLVADPEAKHMFICDSHKNTIQHFRNKQKNREGRNSEHIDLSDRPSQIDINFSLLPVSLLRRYKRHFKLATRPGINKAQLADIVAKHFSKQQVDEKEVLTHFLYTCKNKNRQENSESLS